MTGRVRARVASGTLGVLLCAAAGTWVLLAHVALAPGLGRLAPALRLPLAAACFLLPAGRLVVDLMRGFRATPWRPGTAGEVRRLWVAAVVTGVLASVLFPGLAWFRPGPRLTRDLALLIWGWTLWGNLLICLGAASTLMGLLSLGRLARRAWAELLFVGLGLWVGLAWALFEAFTGALTRAGQPAKILAGLVASGPPAALAVVFGFWLAAAWPAAGEECALDFLLRPLALRGRALAALAWLLAVAVLGGGTLFLAERSGLALLLQETLALIVGLGFFAGMFAWLPLRQPRILWVYALILTPLLCLGLFLDFEEGLQARAHPGFALDLETGRDAEVRLLRVALDPPHRSGSAWLDPEDELLP